MIDILFEDNHLLILNKPSGIMTEPSGTEQESLQCQAKAYLKDKYQKPGNVYLGIVHRLDKPASGVVLFAKTSKALSRLNQATREKKYKKLYTALVEGKPSQSEMTLEHYLIHDDYKAKVASKNNPLAKRSVLHFKTLKTNQTTTLLEVLLETGRYHQIRAQLSSIGCPIVGDEKYGSKTAFINPHGIALHHTRLEFLHPVTGEIIIVEAPLPTGF